MNDLIAQLEKATGPDRSLDQDIHEAAIGLQMYECFFVHGNTLCIRYYPGPPGPEYRTLPRYTASIDAARALIRVGLRWYVADSDDRSDDKPVAAVFDTETMLREGRIPRSVGATPAIALSIAAIKYIQHRGEK